MSQSVFEYRDYREFLRYCKGKRSLERWASELGYQSPRGIAMVLKGQRHPSRDMLRSLQQNLQLTGRAKEYFELLVEESRLLERGDRDEDLLSSIEKLRRECESPAVLDTATQKLLVKWYILPLKQICICDSFRKDPKWIRGRLRNKVSEDEIRYALEVLENTKILIWDPESERYNLGIEKSIRSTNDIPSQAVRDHHREMMDRALEALDEQAISNRQFSSLTFRIDREEIPAAKAAIREFVSEFNFRFGEQEDTSQESVFQLNLQMFEHSSESEASDD